MGGQIWEIHWIHLACSHKLGSLCAQVTLCSLIELSGSSAVQRTSTLLIPTRYSSCQPQTSLGRGFVSAGIWALLVLQSFDLAEMCKIYFVVYEDAFGKPQSEHGTA